MPYKSVLLVEDDIFTSRLIKKYLECRDVIVHQAFDVGSAFNKAVENNIDLVILDLSLPSGFSLDHFKELKSVVNSPIVIYTARRDEEIELLSLNLGADDFIQKERGVKVLYARIKKHLNFEEVGELSDAESEETELSINGFSFDKGANTVTHESTLLELTLKEMSIIYYLAINSNRAVSRDELSFITKGYAYDGWSRSMDLSVFRLRKKLDSAFEKSLSISTIRGKGYQLNFND